MPRSCSALKSRFRVILWLGFDGLGQGGEGLFDGDVSLAGDPSLHGRLKGVR